MYFFSTLLFCEEFGSSELHPSHPPSQSSAQPEKCVHIYKAVWLSVGHALRRRGSVYIPVSGDFLTDFGLPHWEVRHIKAQVSYSLDNL